MIFHYQCITKINSGNWKFITSEELCQSPFCLYSVHQNEIFMINLTFIDSSSAVYLKKYIYGGLIVSHMKLERLCKMCTFLWSQCEQCKEAFSGQITFYQVAEKHRCVTWSGCIIINNTWSDRLTHLCALLKQPHSPRCTGHNIP